MRNVLWLFPFFAGLLILADDTAGRQEGPRLLPLTQRVNSRVRFIESGADSSWRYGMLNRYRFEPPCFVVMIFEPGMRVKREVPLDSVYRLQLSTYFDGSHGPVTWHDTTTQSGETWWEVPSDTLGAAVKMCQSRKK